MPRRADNIAFENVELMGGDFMNFEGRPTRFNKDGGDRSFAIRIPTDEIATELADNGWKVKWTKPSADGISVPYMPVKVRFDRYPPKVLFAMCDPNTIDPKTGQAKITKVTVVGEEEIGELDHEDIVNVDVVLSPYNWERNGESGRTTYLKSICAKIAEDPIEARYSAWIADDDGDLPFNPDLPY